MKEIKFRGKTKKGKIIYSNGYLNGMLYEKCWHRVVECELFIGCDKNGNEIYEGDKVIRIAGEEIPMAATFEDFAAIRDGEIIKCVR